jgi:hypothetical protein
MKAVPAQRGVFRRHAAQTRKAPRVLAGLALASGVLGVTSLISSGGTAQADPAATSGIVGVGADVTQDLWAAYTGASPAPGLASNTSFYTPLNAGSANNFVSVQSYDANPPGGTTVAPGCIVTRAGGNAYDRPNSSTAGIAALLDSVQGVGFENTSGSCTGTPESLTGQIDFARSARGPKSTSASTLTFIPYARDGVGVLFYDPHSGTDPLHALTAAELTSLYTSASGSETINGVTVYACLTISGSAPRSNLESTLGITDTQAAAAAAAANGGQCPSITQNSGNAFYAAVSSLPAGSGAVIPISSGSWESQANGVALDRSNTARANGVSLADITNSGNTDLGQPYTVSGGLEVPSTTYYQDTAWGYNLYTVVPTSKIGSGFGSSAPLKALFVGTGSSQCAAAAQTTAHLFGFDSLTGTEGTCGSTTTTGTT